MESYFFSKAWIHVFEMWMFSSLLTVLQIAKVESDTNVVKLSAKEKPSLRDAESGLHAVLFVKMKDKFLDIPVVENHLVKNFNDCLVVCAGNPICISANFAKTPQQNGKHKCDLMDVGLYKNTSKLKNDPSTVFVNVKKKCFYSPCKNGGVCIALDYKNDTYTCKCPPETRGSHCEIRMVPLMQDGRILDSQINASSNLKVGEIDTTEARLVVGLGWAPLTMNIGEYLQIDLLVITQIIKIATQGRKYGLDQFVTKYKLNYKSGSSWVFYQENSVDKVFDGNFDMNTAVSHVLANPVNTSVVQFYPQEWNLYPYLRVELYTWSQ